MGKSGRCYRELGRKNYNDYRYDSKNPNDDAYDSVMDIYEDQLDSQNERYDWDDENDDDS